MTQVTSSGSAYDICVDMRRAHINPEKSNVILTDNRIASLDALGCNWNPDTKKKSFEQRIEELRSYKKKHGHIQRNLTGP